MLRHRLKTGDVASRSERTHDCLTIHNFYPPSGTPVYYSCHYAVIKHEQ